MRAAGLVCTVAVLATAAGVGTARADEPRVELGIRAGLNLASVHGDDVTINNLSPESRVGFSGGLFAGIRVTPSFLIQPEVLYTQKGARYEAAGEEAVIKLDYVEVPVLLKGRFGSGSAKPSVFAGPAVAFKVSGKTEFQGEEEDVEDVKGTDFGIVFGAGLDLAVGSGAFTIDARYTLGLTTFSDSPDPDDVKNGVWTFSVGYAF
jgi:hypothetical protein